MIPPRPSKFTFQTMRWINLILQEWDILAYKAVGIEPDRIYNVMEDSSILVEGSGVKTSYGEMISNVTSLFP